MSIEVASDRPAPLAPPEVNTAAESGVSIHDLSDDEILELLRESAAEGLPDAEAAGLELAWLDEIAAWLEEPASAVAVSGESGLSGGDGYPRDAATSADGANLLQAGYLTQGAEALATAGERALIARELRAVSDARTAVTFAQGLAGSALSAAAGRRG